MTTLVLIYLPEPSGCSVSQLNTASSEAVAPFCHQGGRAALSVKHRLTRDKPGSEIGIAGRTFAKHLRRICGSGGDIVRVCKQRSINSLGTGPSISCTIVGIDRGPCFIGRRLLQSRYADRRCWSPFLFQTAIPRPSLGHASIFPGPCQRPCGRARGRQGRT